MHLHSRCPCSSSYKSRDSKHTHIKKRKGVNGLIELVEIMLETKHDQERERHTQNEINQALKGRIGASMILPQA